MIQVLLSLPGWSLIESLTRDSGWQEIELKVNSIHSLFSTVKCAILLHIS
jgi:hypothetical protein